MEELLERCCGLDVHKDTIVACIMIGYGAQKRKTIRTFSTFTKDIRELAEWLKSNDIRHVAVESTGIYWKPIFNIFDGDFDICLVNAQHIKNVPGKKTDVKDSEWLCRLLKSGLLSKSFIPPKEIVHLRELVRYRAALKRDLSKAKNRLIKTLENANIKLSTVFSDVFGVTAWSIINRIVAGETNLKSLTEYIPGMVKASREEIQNALDGTLEEHDRQMLKMMMENIRHLENLIARMEDKIAAHLAPYHAEMTLLKTIPGVQDLSAASIIAEIGVNMDQFKDDSHLAAWAGMCPGNNQSAGKIKSSRIRNGNRHLKIILTQIAWAISHTKHTYLGKKFRSLAFRRGRKKAVIAIGRKALVICYHMLKNKKPFQELGEAFLDNLEPARKIQYFTKRLEEMGYDTKLTKKIA